MEHCCAGIQTNDFAGRSQVVREFSGRVSEAAADIEHPFAAGQPEMFPLPGAQVDGGAPSGVGNHASQQGFWI
jgi:hypothetical protein